MRVIAYATSAVLCLVPATAIYDQNGRYCGDVSPENDGNRN